MKRSGSRRSRTLVGRDAEITELGSVIDSLGEGDNGAVYLTGEPGIGKTSLIGEALVRAEERGYRTLAGRAAEFESDVPFGIVVDALEHPVRSAGRDGLAMTDDEIYLLASVFPSLAPTAGAEHGVNRPEEHRLLRALRALLGGLARERPLVVALDDLHWGDAASIDLVCHLLHRGLEGRVLLILASRPAQSDSRLLAALEEAERHGTGRRLELTPLSLAEAEELLGDRVEPAQRGSLYQESGGNPFYLEQLVGAAHRGDDLMSSPRDRAQAGVPAVVRAAIRGELDALAPLARTVLQAAAILGDPFDADLVAVTAEVSEGHAIEALDELLAQDLLRAGKTPRRFRFRHPIVRHAVCELAGDAWSLDAHGRAAGALAAQGAAASSFAHHLEHSAHVGDEAAIVTLVRAAEEVASRAPSSAAEWFGAALRLIPDSSDNIERRLGLLARRAAALGSAGDVEENRETLRAFLRLSPRDASPLRLRVATMAAMLDELVGRDQEARELLRNELAAAPDRESPDTADLKRVLAFTYYLDADWESVSEWARASLSGGAAGMVEVGARSALAIAEQGLGDAEGAKRSSTSAAEVFDRLADEEVAEQAGITAWLGWAEICVEDFDSAARHLRRAAGISMASGQRIATVSLLMAHGRALAFRGQLEELMEVAESAVEAALMTASSLFITWALALRCDLEIRRGDLLAAVRFGERALGASASSSSPLAQVARGPLAEALLEIGEPERCREQLVGPDGEPDLPPFRIYGPLYHELLTRAELMLGRSDRAADLARRAEDMAHRLKLGVPLAHALRAQALVSLERGDAEGAAAQARDSVLAAEQAGAAVEAARSRILAGRSLSLAGERNRAVDELQTAHAQLAACGALRDCQEAARELRKLGRVVRRAGGKDEESPLTGLTPRELEVIGYLADGRTNREIADALFLSVRTVDRHVSRIFDKLGVNSRAAAVSQFERARALARPSRG